MYKTLNDALEKYRKYRELSTLKRQKRIFHCKFTIYESFEKMRCSIWENIQGISFFKKEVKTKLLNNLKEIYSC